MLILTRRPNEALVVRVNGVRVVIRVGRVNGNQVRLGIEAPQEVSIVREELERRDEAAAKEGA